jgi:hypothetical protein
MTELTAPVITDVIPVIDDPSGSPEAKKMTISSLLNLVYPVGSIYISVSSTSPDTLFGGTWAAFGTGRTIVGIDTGDSDFHEAEHTGGHKSLQSHTHTYNTNQSNAVFTSSGGTGMDIRGTDNATTSSTGTGNSQNLQPYIVTYMFKRTA